MTEKLNYADVFQQVYVDQSYGEYGVVFFTGVLIVLAIVIICSVFQIPIATNRPSLIIQLVCIIIASNWLWWFALFLYAVMFWKELIFGFKETK